MIDSIANLSAAQTMSKVQMAIATKVLSIANDQGQAALALLDAAAETTQEAVQSVNVTTAAVDVYA